ncbi:S8 family peptidase [Massilia cavernae]|uniref:Peptidase S8 and S53 subtilisin kexin sedolisin n=1 Tax=Massilia cavernae TaxID=2320864 RepID=A0A418Y752_9BURK|nr:S8 family serine peptidase [Massilia cavernae]RJG25724.1 peptidase S8 and S53 subtilisin kexin sedolisin [Massilia cavernae]
MNIRTAAGVLALCAALPAGALQQDAAMAEQAPAGTAAQVQPEASRQVLVMLRLPPQHFHPDAAYAGRYPNDGGRAARRRAGQQLARAHGLELVDDWPMPVIGIDCYVMQHKGSDPLGPVLAALARDPRVVWAQPMNTYNTLDGGDPLFAAQPAARYWRLDELHKSGTGRGVRVAVIDSGIDGAHPDLAGQVQLRENFVTASPDAAEAHGTAIAGIIAARAGNGVGIAGIAPDARLLALRACWPDGVATRCNSFTLGKAINSAIMNGAKIINLSLSGPGDRLLQSLLDVAAVRGMVVVGAADPQRADGGFPASHPGVIAVAAASDSAPAKALLAPGSGIPTTAPGARWGFVSGPSYAAAHVAGLAALAAQLDPSIDSGQLRRKILTMQVKRPLSNTAVQAPSLAQAGNIDACATVAHITGACACSCTPITAMKVSSP